MTTPQERLALLASIVESSDEAIISKTLDGIITSWNPAAERMYGYPAAEIVGRHVSMLIPADRAGELLDVLPRLARGEGVEPYETERVRKDGVVIPVALTISPIRDPATGLVIGASAFVHDISERARVDEQLQIASRYARSLIEASLDPLVMISPEGKITDVNEATANVTGLSREALVGTDFFDYFTEPDRAREGYQEVFAQGSVTDYPLTIRHRDGTLTDVLYNGSVYKNAKGNVLGVFAAARDVTAQKRVEAQLAEQRGKELERLAELERFQRLTVGRELKMIELKKEIGELRGDQPAAAAVPA